MPARAPAHFAPTDPVPGRCNARKTDGSGHLCRKGAGEGTDHAGVGNCKWHLGSTRNGRKHASNMLVARRLDELLAEHEALIGEMADPIAAVLEVVRSTWALRRSLEMRVRELMDRPTVDDEDLPVEALYGENHLGDMVPHALVGMLERATDAHLKACRVAIEQGIAERQLRIEEDKVELMAQAIRGIVEGLGRSFDEPEVQQLVAGTLRALPGGAA